MSVCLVVGATSPYGKPRRRCHFSGPLPFTFAGHRVFFKRKPSAPPLTERLDYRLLERGAIALYHKPAVLAHDLAWFRAQQYAVYELDGAGWTTAEAFHVDAQRVFGFPTFYAKNFAAWVDFLGELAIPDESGAVIQFRRYDRFAGADRELAQRILDSIEVTSRRFMLTGRRLIALVQSDDPRIRFERVGALPVTWNPAEWSEEQRGIRAG